MRSLKRAFTVLTAIGDSSVGMTLQELATQLNVAPATMHRLLATLEDEELVVRSLAGRRYFIGPNVVSFARASVRSRRLHHIPPGALAQAAVASGQTLFLTEMIEGRAVCVAIAQGRRQFRLHAVLGREMPMHAAASARILLVDVADDQILGLFRRLTLDRRAAHTPTTPEEVLGRIQQARRRGYDLCDNDLDHDKWGVAVPVRDGTGRARQGLTMIADGNRTRRHGTRENLIKLTRNAAGELAAAAHAAVTGPMPLSHDIGPSILGHPWSTGREVGPVRKQSAVAPGQLGRIG